MYSIVTTNRFDKEVNRCIKRAYDISLLKEAMQILAEPELFPRNTNPIN